MTEQLLDMLVHKVASEVHLNDRIESMFRGDKINLTENRSVLHVALRMQEEDADEGLK